MKVLYCWLFKHSWMWTVVTHHDAQEGLRMGDGFYRGIWHERICTNCQRNEAVYKETIYSWHPADPTVSGYDFKPTEHLPFPGDWST